MSRTESYDSRVLRWSGFAMAAFITAAMTVGLAHAEGDGDHGRGGPPGKRQPPPAAFEACQGKKAADACKVVFREHEIQGTCNAHEDGRRGRCES